MKIYYCYSGRRDELEVIQVEKPERLILSYFYFRNKALKSVIEKLEYKLEIMLDSGAYSAYTGGKNIALPDYLNYILQNKEYIDKYIALDVIGDSYLTFKYYEIMKEKGFNPLPVFHYGEDYIYLARYYNSGEKYIALGGVIGIGGCVGKVKNQEAIKWINTCKSFYPDVNFHLLGSSSKEILNNTQLYSCDSSTWIKMAFNGKHNLSSLIPKRDQKLKIMGFYLREQKDKMEQDLFYSQDIFC